MRTLFAVVASLIVVVVAVFLIDAVAFVGLGERTWRGDTLDVSMLYVGIMAAGGFVMSVVGGAIAKILGRSSTAPLSLALLLLIAGVSAAINVPTQRRAALDRLDEQARSQAEAGLRPESLAMTEAPFLRVEPGWFLWGKSLITTVGVLGGSVLVPTRRSSPAD